MKGATIILDSNLLVLFVVGSTSRRLIAQHKKLRAYSASDFDLLDRMLTAARTVIPTPNTLTETSNLFGAIDEPARSKIFATFGLLIGHYSEQYVASRDVVKRREFTRLGLTDSALLEASNDGAYLLTSDVELYLAASRSGRKAENFNHYRDKLA
jgi:hypothetical protein